ncbi:hypothetical protein ACTWQB_10250 [Piscibacillus sp. B03]|uniref:hypothetical protein n=1 Tax=Piscibacillus sp. B03 TaxID=3457430 RepID=UPI003FCC4AF9
MSKEQLKGLFLLWVMVIFVELIWLLNVVANNPQAEFVAFVVTLVAATLTVGAVGLKLVGKFIN